MNATVLATLTLGGIAALDATPVAQTLLFQPLVTSTILGWMWQDWSMALSVGIVLQILASATIPVGVRTPEDYSVGGVIGVGIALGLAAQQPLVLARDGCAFLGVLAGIVSAAGGVPLLKWQRRRNEGLSRWCEAELRMGSEGALAKSHGAAVLLAFAIGFGYCAVCWTGGILALRGLLDHESLRLSRAWSFAEPAWIGLGLAYLLHSFVRRRLARAVAFGAALIAAWLVLMIEAS